MALVLSALLLAAFLANVFVGSLAGNPIVGDVGEMLILFAAAIAFVVAILKREADETKKNNR